MTQTTPAKRTTTLRTPEIADAQGMVRLARESRVLDVNSDYAYLLLARDFHDTCVIAEDRGQMLGFATAYRPPQRPDVLFVWQIAIAEAARGEGLASSLLDELVRRCLTAGIPFVEATVTQSNAASRALFKSLARRHNTHCTVTEGFPADAFGTTGHEPEDLFRVGPFSGSGLAQPPPHEESTLPD